MAFSDFTDQRWDSIQNLVIRDLQEEGFELADLQFHRAKGRYLLRIFMDHEKGINIDDCERMSQKISSSLDAVDLIPGPYVLEVSSPGLDRPLKKEKDFIRFQGHWIKISFSEPGQKVQSIEAKILSFDEHILTVEDRKQIKHCIPLSFILKAKLIVDF